MDLEGGLSDLFSIEFQAIELTKGPVKGLLYVESQKFLMLYRHPSTPQTRQLSLYTPYYPYLTNNNTATAAKAT